MINKIKYGNSVIEYSVVKSKRRKTSEIIVDKTGVVIRTPLRKPTSEIKKIVQQKKHWIFKKQLEFNKGPIQKPITNTYSRRFLKKRMNFYSEKLGIYPQKIVFKKLKSKWGSATRDNVINLNVNLLKAPKDVIDYVILHELCHLKIHNHSYRFWRLLNKFMPRYKEQRNWLEANSTSIVD